MDETEWLTEQFAQRRNHLHAVAYRMLGSSTEADDALQEAWLRVGRADASEVDNLAGWFTTIVSRVCLNMLQSRKTRREAPLDERVPEPADHADPEHDAVLADSVGSALLIVLDTLSPAERLAFVLHDLFGMPFDEIAPIVERTPAAARQLASRARRRVQGGTTAPDPRRQREVVAAFLAASRGGDFAALLALLDPDVVLRADAAAVHTGAEAEVRGAGAVAETFAGRARAARPALVDGVAGLVWAQGGVPRVVFDFTIRDGRIAAIDLLADPDLLAGMDLELLRG